MKPKAFLVLAQQLSRNATCEASLRTCVSRSYYALFNLMAQFIEEHVESLSHAAGDHEKVYHYLYNCGIAEVETIASDLNDLRDERNDSDYKLHLNKFSDNYTVTMWLKAKTAFDSFENLINSRKKRESLAKGILRYKHRTNS